jgi:hypothetical protein
MHALYECTNLINTRLSCICMRSESMPNERSSCRDLSSYYTQSWRNIDARQRCDPRQPVGSRTVRRWPIADYLHATEFGRRLWDHLYNVDVSEPHAWHQQTYGLAGILEESCMRGKDGALSREQARAEMNIYCRKEKLEIEMTWFVSALKRA